MCSNSFVVVFVPFLSFFSFSSLFLLCVAFRKWMYTFIYVFGVSIRQMFFKNKKFPQLQKKEKETKRRTTREAYKQPQFFNWLEFPFWIFHILSTLTSYISFLHFYIFHAGNTHIIYIILQHVGSLSSYLCVAFVSTVSFSHFPPFVKREKNEQEKKKKFFWIVKPKASIAWYIHMDRILIRLYSEFFLYFFFVFMQYYYPQKIKDSKNVREKQCWKKRISLPQHSIETFMHFLVLH